MNFKSFEVEWEMDNNRISGDNIIVFHSANTWWSFCPVFNASITAKVNLTLWQEFMMKYGLQEGVYVLSEPVLKLSGFQLLKQDLMAHSIKSFLGCCIYGISVRPRTGFRCGAYLYCFGVRMRINADFQVAQARGRLLCAAPRPHYAAPRPRSQPAGLAFHVHSA